MSLVVLLKRLAILASLMCLVAAPAAWAQLDEEDDAPVDEEVVDGEEPMDEEVEDLEGVEEEGEEGEGEAVAGREGPTEVRPASTGIHPSYTLSYDRNRDQATWNHGFNFNYSYTPRVTVTSSSTIRKKSSLTADRLSRTESTSNGIDFKVAEGLTMGFGVTRNWSEDVTGGGAGTTKERVQEGLEVNATYSTLFLGVLDTRIQAGAGTENREYSDVVSEGNTERISASVNFDPMENLKTSFSYSGNLRISDSEQQGFVSRDRNVDEKVSMTADYNFWEKQRISFTVSGMQTEAQYPSDGQQETRSMDDRNVSINSSLLLLGGLKMNVKFNASDATTFYRVDRARDNRKTSQGLQISLPKRHLVWGVSGNLTVQDEKRRNEFQNPQTGTTIKHSILGGVDRELGSNSSMALKGRIELTRYEFDDRVRNTRDRDVLNHGLQLDLSYRPKLISADLSAEYKRAEQIGIMPSSVGDNNTRHTYSIRPSFAVSLWRKIRVTQNYNLSADYTLYHTDEARNLLVRIASTSTGITFPLVEGVKLNVSYDYQLQDQGSYREDAGGVSRYARASESQRQRLSLRTGVNVGPVSISASQAYELKKQWDFPNAERRLKFDSSSMDISGTLRAKFNIGSRTTADISLTQTQREGRRLSENERKFWNVGVNMRHSF